jgi:hypothetical protein
MPVTSTQRAPAPLGAWHDRPAQARAPRRLAVGSLAACGIAAIALTAALVASSASHLPLGVDRYSGLTVGLAVATGLTTLVWPELAVPAIVIGAGLLDSQFGGERVRHLVFVKLALFACAGLGVALASIARHSRFARVRTAADAPALCLVGYTAVSAVYGFVVAGHQLDSVAVAGYHLSQLALYHFLVTTTLCRPDSVRRAGMIVIAWSLLWIVPSLLTPGRGGGTASTWLIVLLCYAAVCRPWWAPLAWTVLPLALLDTLTSGYRTLWVSVAGQLAWLASCGFEGRLRWLRGAAAALLVVGVMGAALIVSRPSLLTPVPAAETLQRFAASITDGGYRMPEAVVGLAAFRESPVFGRGVGYQSPTLWIRTMGYMTVGPVYHLYYVGYLANEGIVGLGIVLWYFLAVLYSRQARRARQQASDDPWAAAGFGLQAAFFGAAVGAFLSGPSDGHWTWGVLGAGALLHAGWVRPQLTDSGGGALQGAGIRAGRHAEALRRTRATHGTV